jgi:ethanolamine utilization protein EutQ (cupin superfamily)
LNDGTILIAGGLDGSYAPTAAAEIYDPSAGTFTAIASMHFARAYHTATLLPDGTVLIVGGTLDALGDTEPTSGDHGAEIYNPTTKTFSITTHSLPHVRERAQFRNCRAHRDPPSP